MIRRAPPRSRAPQRVREQQRGERLLVRRGERPEQCAIPAGHRVFELEPQLAVREASKAAATERRIGGAVESYREQDAVLREAEDDHGAIRPILPYPPVGETVATTDPTSPRNHDRSMR